MDDAVGATGRLYAWAKAPDACSDVSVEGRGPWPGSFYTWPLASVVLVGLVVAGIAIASVTRRPRQGEDPGLDDALRRQVANGVTAAVGLLVTVPLVSVGIVAAAGLLQICAAPAAWTAVGTLLLGVVPLALALGLWCAALLVVPHRVRTTEPAQP